jgi:hypothetical protein
MRAGTFVLALCLVAAVQAGDPCEKHKDCPNKKDFCAKEGGCTPCSSCTDNALSITGKCPCGPAKKKLGGKCTSHKGCTMKEFCPKPEENGAQVCKPCRECKDHPDSSTDKCPCGPGKKNGPLGGDCKASHDDCRVQDFCGTLRPGKCELCIKCVDHKNSADGDCPCGPAYVATVRKTCVVAMQSKDCLGKPTKACESCSMASKEELLKAGCTVPFVRKQCAVAAKASTDSKGTKGEVDDLIDGLETDL